MAIRPQQVLDAVAAAAAKDSHSSFKRPPSASITCCSSSAIDCRARDIRPAASSSTGGANQIVPDATIRGLAHGAIRRVHRAAGNSHLTRTDCSFVAQSATIARLLHLDFGVRNENSHGTVGELVLRLSFVKRTVSSLPPKARFSRIPSGRVRCCAPCIESDRAYAKWCARGATRRSCSTSLRVVVGRPGG
jgi:hypothetical protein